MRSAIYLRDFLQRHDLHFASASPDAENLLVVRVLTAALLDQEKIALCPQSVLRPCPAAAVEMRIGRAEASASLEIYAAFHELMLQHYHRLPPAGVGMQYFIWIARLFDLARLSISPQDGAQANVLAQRLLLEDPCPDEYESSRSLALSGRLGAGL